MHVQRVLSIQPCTCKISLLGTQKICIAHFVRVCVHKSKKWSSLNYKYSSLKSSNYFFWNEGRYLFIAIFVLYFCILTPDTYMKGYYIQIFYIKIDLKRTSIYTICLNLYDSVFKQNWIVIKIRKIRSKYCAANTKSKDLNRMNTIDFFTNNKMMFICL